MCIVVAMPEGASIDLQTVLKRVEKLEAELASAKGELERKDQIIAALQQRLFGSSSERLDPDQLNLEFDGVTLGKPEAPSPEGGGAESDREAEGNGGAKESAVARRTFSRRTSRSSSRVSISPLKSLLSPRPSSRLARNTTMNSRSPDPPCSGVVAFAKSSSRKRIVAGRP